ncbi:MAG: hypothetical protein JSS20_15340, partial [Proteobacteria bacterium]|nr:hypothetical protein [Pseudomonadota bacterium]
PWGPSVPYITNFLQGVNSAGVNIGPSQDQLDAFATLKNNAAAGNPFTADISKLAKDQFGAASNSGQVQDAYKTLQGQLGDYANGSKLDFSSNPYIQQMLKTVGDDTQKRINEMFAGSGRDITGNAAGQQALGRGITAAQLPILSQLYSQEEQNQIAAAQALNLAGVGAATTGQTLDQNALATRAGGVTTANSAINASNYAPNTILNLDQQLKQMPFSDLSLYASLLLPAAGLGGTSSGSSTSNTESSGFGFGLGDIGKAATAIGTFL